MVIGATGLTSVVAYRAWSGANDGAAIATSDAGFVVGAPAAVGAEFDDPHIDDDPNTRGGTDGEI